VAFCVPTFPNGKTYPKELIMPTKITTPQDIGHIIRQHRQAADIRQADAAALSGVGTRFLSEVERGKSTAELGKVLQVLGRLGLELWLVPRGHDFEKP
jgi:HTH-type transcriptional regulator / antitoxin HipB